MRWKVRGAEASTGNEQTVNIEAGSKEDAEAKARSFGLLVSSVEPAIDPNLYETSGASAVQLDYAAKGGKPGKPARPKLTDDDAGAEQPRKRDLNLGGKAVTVLICIVLVIVMLNGLSDIFDPPYVSYLDHFQGDNAVGSTANSLLDLKRNSVQILGGVKCAISLLGGILLRLLWLKRA